MDAILRAFRIALFDQRAVTRVMLDHGATGDAVLLVAGVNAVVEVVQVFFGGRFSLVGLLEGTLRGLAGWLVLSFAIWLMGTKLLKGNGDPQTMIRTAGFATLPLLLGAFGYGLVGLVWHLALLVLVARQVLGKGWGEAAAAVALGAALIFAIQTLVGGALFRF
ncbi:MAG TPA: YIP1 family protein [Acidimicrobiia bacterium]|jgi:hypothetical protein